MKPPRRACIVASLGLIACTGSIGESLPAVEISACDGTVRPGPAPLRRLTRLEYDNTVRDLFGVTTHFGRDGLQPDETDPNGFDTEARLQGATSGTIEAYETVAGRIAAHVMSEARTRVVDCEPASPECVAHIIDRLGGRIFRRPLAPAERERYSEFFEATRGHHGFDTAAQLLVEAMLQAPAFLYRTERLPEDAEPGTVVQLDDYAIAQRLSYTLLRSMPDDDLFAKAANGELSSADAIEAEARRLLSTDDARAAVQDFFAQWLRIDPLMAATKTDPEFTDDVRNAMLEETRRFLDDAAWNQPDVVQALFAGTYSYVNGPLARFYGLDAPNGDAFGYVELDSTTRKGVMTRGAWLAANAGPDKTRPVARGVFIEREVLCNALGEPPPDAEQVVSETDISGNPRSVRESFEEHVQNPVCAGCHKRIDALGFAFEAYGPAGKLRTQDDNGFPVDASGVLEPSVIKDKPSWSDPSVKFADASALADILASSSKVSTCMVQQQLEFHLGRTRRADDACTQETLHHAFRDAGFDFRELLVALVRSDAFRYRIVE